MANSGVLKVACFVLVCMVLGAPMGQVSGAVTCNAVAGYLSPCISYVSYGGAVPAACCAGIKSLYGAAQAPADRRTACTCIKTAISGVRYSGNNVALAAGLPGKCGVNLPFKISPSIDCNRVQ